MEKSSSARGTLREMDSLAVDRCNHPPHTWS